MGLFKKHWTAEEADEWTVHDFAACLFGVLAYVLVTIGLTGACLLQVWGFVCVALALVCLVLMILVIDPKLRAVSHSYEEKQAAYLESLEKRIRWEAKDGD